MSNSIKKVNKIELSSIKCIIFTKDKLLIYILSFKISFYLILVLVVVRIFHKIGQ